MPFEGGSWYGILARTEARHARNILGLAGTTRTRGSCRAQDLGMAGYMARSAFWAVLGLARHENGM